MAERSMERTSVALIAVVEWAKDDHGGILDQEAASGQSEYRVI